MNVLLMSNLIFAVLNVLLILYIFWYFMTRYLIPVLRSGLKAHEQQLVHEQQTYDKTLLEYESIKRQRSVYDLQAQHLLTLIDDWNKKIDQEKQEAALQQQVRLNAIKVYLHKRQEHHQFQRIQDYVFEHAYEQARAQLQKKYTSDIIGKQQVHAIIQSLEGKVHG